MEQFLFESRDLLYTMNRTLETAFWKGKLSQGMAYEILDKTQVDLEERLMEKLHQIAGYREDGFLVENYFCNEGFREFLLLEEPELLGISSLQFAIGWEMRNCRKKEMEIALQPPLWEEHGENRLYGHFLKVLSHFDEIRERMDNQSEWEE